MNKILKKLLVVLSGLCVLVLGIAIGAYLYVRPLADHAFSTDKAQIDQLAGRIAEHHFPVGYEPVLSMELSSVKMALYGHDTNNSVIGLMALPVGAGETEVERAIAQVFERQTQSGVSAVRWTKNETQIVSGNHQSYSVKVWEGTDSKGNAMRRITAVLPGQNGSIGLYVMGATKTWDQPGLNGFLASLN